MRTHHDVLLVAAVLEEQLEVAPEGRCRLRTADNVPDQLVFTVVLRRALIPPNLEHSRVLWNDLQLLVKVVLVLVSPAINIVRLDFDLEGPVRVLLLLAILIELCKIHHRIRSNVVGCRSKKLTLGLSGAVIVHLSDNVGPSILEEVE